jgi:hypothetical protein
MSSIKLSELNVSRKKFVRRFCEYQGRGRIFLQTLWDGKIVWTQIEIFSKIRNLASGCGEGVGALKERR